MLWLGFGLLVVVVILFGVWRITREKVANLGSVSEQWMAEQRRK